MANGNPARTKKAVLRLRREQLRAEVEQRWSEHETIEETAKQLKICPRTVRIYRQQTTQLWQKTQQEFHGTRVLQRAAELYEIIRKATRLYNSNLKKFEESEKPQETVTVTKDKNGNLESTTIKEEESVGDVKFKTEARKCLELILRSNAELRKLFGDNVQPDTEGNQTHNHNNTINQTVIVIEDEKWYGNDAHEQSEHNNNGKHSRNGSDSHAAKAVAASIAGVIESGPVQDGGMRPTVGQNGNGASNGH